MGIGTSEVEHVLATQTLKISKLKNFRVLIDGIPNGNISSKDIILHIIGLIGTAGGNGYAIEFAGSYISSLSMEARMTICNMSIEAGAKVGLVSVDETTISYIKNAARLNENEIKNAENYWQSLHSDDDASFDKELKIDVSLIKPQVTWGTSPEMVIDYDADIPVAKNNNMELARKYMGIEDNQNLLDLAFDKVFIGSCTNSRIEDLREAAKVVDGKKVSKDIKEAMVVPGSGLVKEAAEKEGLDKVFINAGFNWKDPGCSMCLGMNPDQLKPYERCASTSNRNFEGRQGNLGRTHLMSPRLAALVAIHGKLI
ncbi:MAG: aconitase family protein, partial [Gammaproteobacteria bacterium]